MFKQFTCRPISLTFITLFLLLSGGAGCRFFPGAGGSSAAEFDGTRAMQWLQKQMAFGPRVPGTPAHASGQRLLAEALGTGAQIQEFNHDTGHGSVPMANLVARFGPDKGTRILLCAHWDSRPFCDQDPDPAKRAQPLPGANDGASGVAVLLELARLFRVNPPPVGVTIALFDGEDYGKALEDMFLGARYFAKHPLGGPFRYGILLDMVGDDDLQIYRERNSEERAGKEIVDRVWQAAAALNDDHFRPSSRYTIEDDHIPLLDEGIPVIDVIDFDYPYWHTHQDTADKCSARSLKSVGDVMRQVVYSER